MLEAQAFSGRALFSGLISGSFLEGKKTLAGVAVAAMAAPSLLSAAWQSGSLAAHRAVQSAVPIPFEVFHPISVPIETGWTLTRFASQYHTTIDALLAANPAIKNPDVIQAGNSLIIPTLEKMSVSLPGTVLPPLPGVRDGWSILFDGISWLSTGVEWALWAVLGSVVIWGLWRAWIFFRPFRLQRMTAALLLSVFLLPSSWSSSHTGIRGVVRGVQADENKIVIEHEAIPNVMGAMTMPFRVSSPDLLRGAKPGDAVVFDLETEGGFVITQLKQGIAKTPRVSADSHASDLRLVESWKRLSPLAQQAADRRLREAALRRELRAAAQKPQLHLEAGLQVQRDGILAGPALVLRLPNPLSPQRRHEADRANRLEGAELEFESQRLKNSAAAETLKKSTVLEQELQGSHGLPDWNDWPFDESLVQIESRKAVLPAIEALLHAESRLEGARRRWFSRLNPAAWGIQVRLWPPAASVDPQWRRYGRYDPESQARALSQAVAEFRAARARVCAELEGALALAGAEGDEEAQRELFGPAVKHAFAREALWRRMQDQVHARFTLSLWGLRPGDPVDVVRQKVAGSFAEAWETPEAMARALSEKLHARNLSKGEPLFRDALAEVIGAARTRIEPEDLRAVLRDAGALAHRDARRSPLQGGMDAHLAAQSHDPVNRMPGSDSLTARAMTSTVGGEAEVPVRPFAFHRELGRMEDFQAREAQSLAAETWNEHVIRSSLAGLQLELVPVEIQALERERDLAQANGDPEDRQVVVQTLIRERKGVLSAARAMQRFFADESTFSADASFQKALSRFKRARAAQALADAGRLDAGAMMQEAGRGRRMGMGMFDFSRWVANRLSRRTDERWLAAKTVERSLLEAQQAYAQLLRARQALDSDRQWRKQKLSLFDEAIRMFDESQGNSAVLVRLFSEREQESVHLKSLQQRREFLDRVFQAWQDGLHQPDVPPALRSAIQNVRREQSLAEHAQGVRLVRWDKEFWEHAGGRLTSWNAESIAYAARMSNASTPEQRLGLAAGVAWQPSGKKDRQRELRRALGDAVVHDFEVRQEWERERAAARVQARVAGEWAQALNDFVGLHTVSPLESLRTRLDWLEANRQREAWLIHAGDPVEPRSETAGLQSPLRFWVSRDPGEVSRRTALLCPCGSMGEGEGCEMPLQKNPGAGRRLVMQGHLDRMSAGAGVLAGPLVLFDGGARGASKTLWNNGWEQRQSRSEMNQETMRTRMNRFWEIQNAARQRVIDAWQTLVLSDGNFALYRQTLARIAQDRSIMESAAARLGADLTILRERLPESLEELGVRQVEEALPAPHDLRAVDEVLPVLPRAHGASA